MGTAQGNIYKVLCNYVNRKRRELPVCVCAAKLHGRLFRHEKSSTGNNVGL
jgi:hypothetical protein